MRGLQWPVKAAFFARLSSIFQTPHNLFGPWSMSETVPEPLPRLLGDVGGGGEKRLTRVSHPRLIGVEADSMLGRD